MLFASKPMQNATKPSNGDNYTQRNVKSVFRANVKCTKFCLKNGNREGEMPAGSSPSFLFHVKQENDHHHFFVNRKTIIFINFCKVDTDHHQFSFHVKW